MLTCLEILLAIFDYLLSYLFFAFYLEPRKWPNRLFPAAGTCFFIGLQIFTAFFHLHLIDVLFSTIMIAAICFLFYKGRIVPKLLLVFLTVFFSVTIETLAGLFVSLLFQIDASQLIDYPELACCSTVLYLFIKLLVVLFLDKKKNTAKQTGQYNFISWELMCIPLLSFLGAILCIYLNLTKEQPDYILMFAILLLLIFINIIYYVVLQSHTKLHHQNTQNLLKAQEYELKDTYYQNIERYQKEIRTIRHDLKNQLLTITAYMQSPQDVKASEEIAAMITQLERTESMSFTGHQGLNMLLNSKKQTAEKNHIICDFIIKVPEQMQFRQKDLGSLAGNILDNAIEACQKCSGRRYIHLKMLYFNHSLVIICENSTDGNVRDLTTRKSETRSHGLGLRSIRTITEQYHGDMECTIEKDHFHLELTIWEPKQ